MRTHSRLRRLLALCGVTFALTLATATPAHAGASADSRFGVEKFGDEAIRDLALRLNDALDTRQVNVAILARAGRPRSELPAGISYTHVAIAVFEAVQGADGAVFHTYTVYNLYQGADGRDDRSYLQQDLTYDFVAGTAERDIAVCVPVPALQQRLLRVVRSSAYAALHNPDYNLVTNPWIDRFDNCVTHTLKLCVAAIYETDDRERIYRNLRAHFEPTPVRLGPLRALGSRFVTGVSHEDRDPRRGLQTASYDSLHAFLATNDLVEEAFVVTLR